MLKALQKILNLFQLILSYFGTKDIRGLSKDFVTHYSFWHRKKKPQGEQYPFVLHDPFEVIGEESYGLENLHLVGDNWLECPEKPIAIIIGCNDWKYGFIADYLPEYRTAFGSRRLVGSNMVSILSKLTIKPEVAVIWGYTETLLLRVYLKFRKIPIWRAEDAFLRSASLGATHSTPYSLVFDKTGLYYNGKAESDIEILLNTYDFTKNEYLQRDAEKILQTIVDQKISKYNPPIVCYDNSLKTKKRVLVIGQVDSDSSLKYGNPNKWSVEDMIILAKQENPNAEILYRPHPEVYKGYQKSKVRKNYIESYVQILSPDEHIVELINRIDHVYTLTSLTGLEALIRNKRVTVLGTPFYAGWGLTDDRCEFSRRTRKLSLMELFIATYILYPKYLAETIKGIGKTDAILATIYKIKGDVLEDMYRLSTSITSKNLSHDLQYKLIHNLKKIDELSSLQLKEIFVYFKKYNIEDFMLYLFFGVLDKSKRLIFLREIASVVKYEVYLSFLKDIQDEIDVEDRNQLVVNFLTYHSNRVHRGEIESLFVETAIATRMNFQARLSKQSEFQESNKGSELKDLCEEVERANINFKLNELKVSMEYADYEHSLIILKKLLTFPQQDYINFLNQASVLLYQRFKFLESQGLALLSMMLDINKNNRKGLTRYIEARYILDKYELSAESLNWFFLSIKTNPELISKYRALLGRNNNLFNLINIGIFLDKEQSISKMMGYIEAGSYKQAKNLFNQLCDKSSIRHDKLVKVYTDFLHAEGRTIEAIDILNQYKRHDNSEFILRQLMRLYQFIGRFEEAEYIYHECSAQGFDLNTTLYMPILLSKGEYAEGYSQYIVEKFAKKLNYLLGDKYRFASTVYDINYLENSLILAVYGPGDEIRFASIYNDLNNNFEEKKYSISCDRRLYTLFSRSYPAINFLPIARSRSIGPDYPLENYDKLPSIELTSILDNNSYTLLDKFNNIFLVTDFIAKIRISRENFHGKSFLRADNELVQKFSKRLELYKDKILVGINWRSSLTNFSRMEHYLPVEDIGKILELENVQFVNLQYDDCQSELNWINHNYPNKIINFDDIDQYNDFESVAALMKNLDLVIAPATSVAELAGALGVQTWLFSNSAEIDWRKIDKYGTDIWHNSITIVDVDEKGNKQKLVQEIRERLEAFVAELISKQDIKY